MKPIILLPKELFSDSKAFISINIQPAIVSVIIMLSKQILYCYCFSFTRANLLLKGMNSLHLRVILCFKDIHLHKEQSQHRMTPKVQVSGQWMIQSNKIRLLPKVEFSRVKPGHWLPLLNGPLNPTSAHRPGQAVTVAAQRRRLAEFKDGRCNRSS